MQLLLIQVKAAPSCPLNHHVVAAETGAQVELAGGLVVGSVDPSTLFDCFSAFGAQSRIVAEGTTVMAHIPATYFCVGHGGIVQLRRCSILTYDPASRKHRSAIPAVTIARVSGKASHVELVRGKEKGLRTRGPQHLPWRLQKKAPCFLGALMTFP